MKDLNQKQQFAFKIVQEHFLSKNQKPLHLAIYGRPGTGKSRVIHCIRQLLGDKCRIAAFTGSAGYNVDGQTLHSLLKIPVGQPQMDFKGLQLQQQQEYWKNIDYLVIDEISLISQTLLTSIDRNLRQFKTNHCNEPFGS